VQLVASILNFSQAPFLVRLPDAIAGQAYDQVLDTVRGPAPTGVKSIIPPGLTIDEGKRRIAGTPVAAGMYDFVFAGGLYRMGVLKPSVPIELISIQPGKVSFGELAAGELPPPETVTVSNAGKTIGQIDGVTLNGSRQFTISKENCTGAVLQPAQSCRVSVSFQPSAVAAKGELVAVSGGVTGRIPLDGPAGLAARSSRKEFTPPIQRGVPATIDLRSPPAIPTTPPQSGENAQPPLVSFSPLTLTTPTGPAEGTLVITSTPTGASVQHVNDREVEGGKDAQPAFTGTTPFKVNLSEGHYDMLARLNGQTQSFSVTVKAGATVTYNVEFVKSVETTLRIPASKAPPQIVDFSWHGKVLSWKVTGDINEIKIIGSNKQFTMDCLVTSRLEGKYDTAKGKITFSTYTLQVIDANLNHCCPRQY
jgi:hypothetical protein